MTAKKKPRKAREWWGILHDEACPIYGNDLGELDGYKTRGGPLNSRELLHRNL